MQCATLNQSMEYFRRALWLKTTLVASGSTAFLGSGALKAWQGQAPRCRKASINDMLGTTIEVQSVVAVVTVCVMSMGDIKSDGAFAAS